MGHVTYQAGEGGQTSAVPAYSRMEVDTCQQGCFSQTLGAGTEQRPPKPKVWVTSGTLFVPMELKRILHLGYFMCELHWHLCIKSDVSKAHIKLLYFRWSSAILKPHSVWTRAKALFVRQPKEAMWLLIFGLLFIDLKMASVYSYTLAYNELPRIVMRQK